LGLPNDRLPRTFAEAFDQPAVVGDRYSAALNRVNELPMAAAMTREFAPTVGSEAPKHLANGWKAQAYANALVRSAASVSW
jgi:hypothetical protein